MVLPYHFGSGYGFRATWSIYVYFIYEFYQDYMDKDFRMYIVQSTRQLISW